jgi:hypothetical protein
MEENIIENARRMILLLLDNGWVLTDEEITELEDAYVNSRH